MKQSHIRNLEKNNRLINFKWELIRIKKAREMHKREAQGKDASCNLKPNLS